MNSHTSQLQHPGKVKLLPIHASRSHRARSAAFSPIEEPIKALPQKQKQKIGVLGSLIFFGLILFLTLAIVVFNYFWFRVAKIDTIDTQSSPATHTIDQ